MTKETEDTIGTSKAYSNKRGKKNKCSGGQKSSAIARR